jgi:hypothetical protein
MEQTKVSRRNPIKEHITNCAYCGHVHDPNIIISMFKAHGKSSMSYYCDKCRRYHRTKLTTKGIVSLNVLLVKKEKSKSATIRADRMECAYCDHPLEREDFQFLLKKRNVRRTTCRNCHGALTVRRTAQGFYTTNKSGYSRILDSIEKGINRKEFDPVEKKFKFLKDRYPLKKKEQCQK